MFCSLDAVNIMAHETKKRESENKDENSHCPDQEYGGSTQGRGRTHQHC